ncbi:TetR/AcrR family transcriptional regulator [Brevibacterium album]|uniref:TetR/AcrR family transcriptional regulator n=1 Tax=Brevibacterium album TaxID=417948 RepID=UPI0004148BAE|nr:TetR family transcriptional regulator [Brevibacterium album]
MSEGQDLSALGVHSSPPVRRGRPPKITRGLIAEVVPAEGFSGLTVPAVAARLGVTTTTLYRHVPTRAALLALAWDHVLDRHTWPDRNLPWRELLDRHATALWDLLARHPGAVRELSDAVLPARMADLFDDLAVCLVGQGFTADEALLAVDTVIDMTLDHRRGVEGLAQPVDGGSGDLRAQIGSLWEDDGQAGPRREVRRAMRRALAADPRGWFQRKLALVLDGISVGRKPAV